jgi:hypothetical protein
MIPGQIKAQIESLDLVSGSVYLYSFTKTNSIKGNEENRKFRKNIYVKRILILL